MVVLALVLVRPASLLLSLLRTRIDRREMGGVAWFGPKGFASVVYGLLVLSSGIPEADAVFRLVAVCIALSIVAHSSTDVPVAKLFDVPEAFGRPIVPTPHRPGTSRIGRSCGLNTRTGGRAPEPRPSMLRWRPRDAHRWVGWARAPRPPS